MSGPPPAGSGTRSVKLAKAAKKAPDKAGPPVIDPYLPNNGNFGYRVSRYELGSGVQGRDQPALRNGHDHRGHARRAAAPSRSTCRVPLTVSQGVGERPAPPRTSPPRRQVAHRPVVGVACRAALTIEVRYGGSPKPIEALWGDVGFEELTDGVLVAGQPNGAASWFPCDDHPSAKASYRIQISTDSPYRAIANGELISRRARAGHTTWTYEQAEPTSTYLVTLQIGVYAMSPSGRKTPVPMSGGAAERLKRNFDHDFARQPQMMKLFVKLFGPYPLSTGYTVVVTDDELEIPLEAQGISIFGANHCDGIAGRASG